MFHRYIYHMETQFALVNLYLGKDKNSKKYIKVLSERTKLMPFPAYHVKNKTNHELSRFGMCFVPYQIAFIYVLNIETA